MSEVTITAVQPVLGLMVGDTVTVERTHRVDAAIKTGRVTVAGDESEEETLARIAEDVRAARAELGVPPRNASRDAWAAFLAVKHHVTVSDDQSRDDLIDVWDHHDCDTAHGAGPEEDD
ncbi:hypothetical protein JVX90_00305 [Gordonia sp. PDNC005]|uniref:hypothetical protein n=1 Tax=Gordonia sp. PDNC005 TaxID=2811424 RepID=UPI0019669203|nr:hypothetical protein [Gordonia sp. PDNC005]QRY62754.1 hypothetical protein JVX90_00305 [Gordonia sp. PDNC005]